MDTDVLVMGGGMAGFAAGIVASETGLNTMLLRKGQGATSYSSGAIDIMGYFPGFSDAFDSPEDGLKVLAGLAPFHPYSILGYNKDGSIGTTQVIIDQVKQSVDWLKNQLDGTPAALSGSFEKNIHPITVLGTTKPTCLVQETMDPGSFSEDDVLTFVGIRGLVSFNAPVAAKSFLDQQARIGYPPHKVSHVIIDLSPFGIPYNISPISIARHLDHTGSIDTVIDQLSSHVKALNTTVLALPPILGLRHARRNLNRLESELGVRAFELLSLPPSVPGYRLIHSLENRFLENNGKILDGHTAVQGNKEQREVKSVLVKTPRRELTINAKAFILATGKFIGGGIQPTENGLKEPVFNLLPVDERFIEASTLRADKQTEILSLPQNGHGIFAAGLSVDPFFHPIDESGLPDAENLFCAGSIIAGNNYSSVKNGLGVSLSTGYQAGKNAVDYVKEVS